jgi:hypothetical protein
VAVGGARPVTWRAVARILIVAGGCRGRRLAGEMLGEGHAVRITTRSESGRAAIEALGAEAWIGTPDRLATLRGALENVTILCWLLATASGPAQALQALHSSRLEFFLTQAIDTTVRGFVYEIGAATPAGGSEDATGGSASAAGCSARDGEPIVRALAQRNVIPIELLSADPHDAEGWLTQARAAVASLLAGV